jgi:hypothetical protein
MSTEDREERLLRYIEARLAEREEGVEGTITSAPGDAGELWPEAKGCLQLISTLEEVGRLLEDVDPVEPLPETINRFEVLRLLGQGGYG